MGPGPSSSLSQPSVFWPPTLRSELLITAWAAALLKLDSHYNQMPPIQWRWAAAVLTPYNLLEPGLNLARPLVPPAAGWPAAGQLHCGLTWAAGQPDVLKLAFGPALCYMHFSLLFEGRVREGPSLALLLKLLRARGYQQQQQQEEAGAGDGRQLRLREGEVRLTQDHKQEQQCGCEYRGVGAGGAGSGQPQQELQGQQQEAGDEPGSWRAAGHAEQQAESCPGDGAGPQQPQDQAARSDRKWKGASSADNSPLQQQQQQQ